MSDGLSPPEMPRCWHMSPARTDKIRISSTPMHLNDNETGGIQELLPKYKVIQQFPKQC